MEWTDTLMLGSTSNQLPSNSERSVLAARVVTSRGVTFLQTEAATQAETTDSLELLRGFRESARRLVLCDASQMASGRQLGHEIVDLGLADVLATCGRAGREVGIGARDAGLDLSSVIVCNDAEAGCRVLGPQINAGDVVLMLGIRSEVFDRMLELLGRDFSQELAAAA